MTLAVYDAQDRRVFVKSHGDFAPDRRVAIASASKMAPGLALFRLVDAGALSLDSTTGEVLGWTGLPGGHHPAPPAVVHVRPGAEPPLHRAGGQHARAVRGGHAAGTAVAPPGTRFDYGSAHLHVAARMAEVRTGKARRVLLDEQVKAPLGLTSAELACSTFPRNTLGTRHPLIAGSLRSRWTSTRSCSASCTTGAPWGRAVRVRRALRCAVARAP
ncbi:MAG: hypothetical protein EOO71_15555 [Myxococcaceae bacterium]|nr:MAG: hypothetical protein EOO71_15555 [Myxococcaceae bacterium]